MTIVTQTRGLWRRQPFDGPLEVDWSNPLARNLEFAFSGHQHREAVRGRFATITGSVTRDVSERGRHFEFAGTTTTSSAHMGFGSSTLSGLAGNSRPATWAFLVRVDTTTRVNLAECNDGNAVDTGWIVGHITGGFGITRECASNNHRVYTTSNPAAGWRTIVLTTDGSINGTTGKAVWYDGVSQSMTLGANGAGVQGSSAQTLTLGRAGFDTGAGCLDGGIAVALIAERQWGEAEVKAFHDNPWAIFRRRVLRVYGLDAASGTIYAGSLSESLTLTESLSGVSVLGGGLADSLAVTDTASGAAVLGGAVSLSPTLYVDADSFGSHSITQGTTLAPTRYVNTNSFGSPTVSVGAVTLAPTRYTDADSFGSPTVGRGAVTLAPTLYADADSFGAATVTQGGLLLPTLYVNENTFGAHVVVRGAAPDTGEAQATPGYSRGDGRSHRYRVRVGRRWIEVDPLDDASLRAVYIAAEQEAQKAAEGRVAAPRRSAARVVAAAAPKAAGVDYAAVRAEAQRISEMVRAVYAEALQRELIGRLMREQIERDDEDDIELLLMV